MKPTPNPDSRLYSSATPAAKADALIELLAPVLQQMPLAWVEERRRQFMSHYSGCGGSFAVCERVLGFLDEHIAARAGARPDDTGPGRFGDGALRASRTSSRLHPDRT